jgi:hypothetical protein
MTDTQVIDYVSEVLADYNGSADVKRYHNKRVVLSLFH